MPHTNLQCIPIGLHAVDERVNSRISLIRGKDVWEYLSTVDARIVAVWGHRRWLIDIVRAGQIAGGVACAGH